MTASAPASGASFSNVNQEALQRKACLCKVCLLLRNVSLAIQHQDCPVPRNIVALNPGKEMVLRALLPGCAPTQILETVSKILDTMLCSGHLTPRSGSQFHQGHLYFGVESGESREGRLVSSKEENQFNGGVEVAFGLTVTGVFSSSSSMHFVVCCTFLALVPNL